MMRETEQRLASRSSTSSTQVALSSRETVVSAAILSSESSTSAVDTSPVCRRSVYSGAVLTALALKK